MECKHCQEERRRRCVIIAQQEDVEKYKQGIFADAPFVHPFRSPTNHAQRLRALEFAREQGSRVLWVIAHDELLSKEKMSQKASSPEAQQTWLTYDDRRTGGIPGLLPLVLDLPVRFTGEPERGDRLRGVFTNARGWLRGWDLPAPDETRAAETSETEIALAYRPLRLYIEMASKNPELELIDGKRIYVLRQHCKSWYKDGDARQIELRVLVFRSCQTLGVQPTLTAAPP